MTPRRCRVVLAFGLGLGVLARVSALAWWRSHRWLDWQPARGLASQPWRWLHGRWVHLEPAAPGHEHRRLRHRCGLGLGGRLAAIRRAGVVAGLADDGVAAVRLLGHLLALGLSCRTHTAGLSGVLHAGVAVARCGWCSRPRRATRPRAAAGAGLGCQAVWELQVGRSCWRGRPCRRPRRHTWAEA